MMKRFGIGFALLCMAGTTAVLAQEPQQPAQEAQQSVATTDTATTEAPASAAPAEETRELVCRTTRVTGSLTRRTRICMTEAEWAESRRTTGQNVSRAQGQASGGAQCVTNPAGGCN